MLRKTFITGWLVGEVELPLHHAAIVPFISHYWMYSQLSCVVQTG